MAKKVELLENLRRLAGLPPLSEEALATLAEAKSKKNEQDDDEENGKPAFLKKKKNGKNAVEEEDDDDSEDSDDDEDGKPAFLKGKKDEGKKKKNEALTDTKKKAAADAGADIDIVKGDPKLDPEAKKVAGKDAGEEEVIEDTGQDDSTDQNNVTPEKKKGAEFAGADLDVVLGERGNDEVLPVKVMTQVVKEIFNNAKGDEDEKMMEVGSMFNKMLTATFDGPQNRREKLRELANRSEVSKDMMVHEINGKSKFGEKMLRKEALKTYEGDKEDLLVETAHRLMADFKVQPADVEDDEMDESYIAEQMATDRIIQSGGFNPFEKKLTEAALAKAKFGKVRVELVTAVAGAEKSAGILVNGKKFNVAEGRKRGVFNSGEDTTWRNGIDSSTLKKIDSWLAKEIPANAARSK